MKAFAGVPLGLLYYVFMQFAIYRARRYRVTRTVWRGVRFSMRGSGLNYAWRVGLWTLLVVVTLGLALPWRQAALERFKMRYTAYGHLQGRFDGTGGGLFKRGWWLWLLTWMIVAAPIVGMLSSYRVPERGHAQVWSAPDRPGLLFAGAGGAVHLRSLQVHRVALVGVRHALRRCAVFVRTSRGAFIGLYWKVIGWSLLITVGLMIWATAGWGIGHLLLGAEGGTPQQKILLLSQDWRFLIPIALGYVLYILAFWAVMRIYLIHDVWKRVAESTTVHNLAAAAEVAAQGEMAGALGEGLADSLDVVGF